MFMMNMIWVGTINKKYYRTSPPGGGVPRHFPLPSDLWINLQRDSLHVHDEYDLSSWQLVFYYYLSVVLHHLDARGELAKVAWHQDYEVITHDQTSNAIANPWSGLPYWYRLLNLKDYIIEEMRDTHIIVLEVLRVGWELIEVLLSLNSTISFNLVHSSYLFLHRSYTHPGLEFLKVLNPPELLLDPNGATGVGKY